MRQMMGYRLDHETAEREHGMEKQIRQLTEERDRYKAALEQILVTPRNSVAYDPEGVAREALNPGWLRKQIEDAAEYCKGDEMCRMYYARVKEAVEESKL